MPCQDAPKLNKATAPADTIPEARKLRRKVRHHNARKVHHRQGYCIENEEETRAFGDYVFEHVSVVTGP
jgi:hypothetical protein